MIRHDIPTLAIEIREIDNLDAVTVFFQDLGVGKGRVLLECFGSSWTCYFGAMGKYNIREFFLFVGVDYLVNKLGNAPTLKQRKRDEKYLQRVIQAAKIGLQ
jgi:hypothetical protein